VCYVVLFFISKKVISELSALAQDKHSSFSTTTHFLLVKIIAQCHPSLSSFKSLKYTVLHLHSGCLKGLVTLVQFSN